MWTAPKLMTNASTSNIFGSITFSTGGIFAFLGPLIWSSCSSKLICGQQKSRHDSNVCTSNLQYNEEVRTMKKKAPIGGNFIWYAFHFTSFSLSFLLSPQQQEQVFPVQQQASASAPAATSPQRPPGSSLLCLLSPLAPTTVINHCTNGANKIEVVDQHFDTIHTLLPCAATWASSSAIIPASALAGAPATSFAFAVSPLSDCLPCDSSFKMLGWPWKFAIAIF